MARFVFSIGSCKFNYEYRDRFIDGGLTISGTSPDGKLVEVVEIEDHPWFVAVQYHPEFKSKPTVPHPLFRAFVAAAIRYKRALNGVEVE